MFHGVGLHERAEALGENGAAGSGDAAREDDELLSAVACEDVLLAYGRRRQLRQLYENGVSRALVLDYNDFVISGALGKFDVKDSKPCK